VDRRVAFRARPPGRAARGGSTGGFRPRWGRDQARPAGAPVAPPFALARFRGPFCGLRAFCSLPLHV